MLRSRSLLLVCLVCTPLAASSATLFYRVGSTGHALGVSEADAIASGLEILTLAPAQEVEGENLSITTQRVPGTESIGPPGRATQDYTVTNDSGPDGGGTLYLVLKSFDTAIVGNCILLSGLGDCTHDYTGSLSGSSESEGTLTTVGFDLALSNDWLLVALYDADLDETLYFPAIDLGDLGLGDAATLPISFLLSDPKIAWVLEGASTTGVIMLPQLRYDAAFVPIPEPATGLLVALGLCGLAWSGKRRPCGRG